MKKLFLDIQIYETVSNSWHLINATFFASNNTDTSLELNFPMDLTSLIVDDGLDWTNPEGWATEMDGQVFNGRYVIKEFSHEDKLVLTKNDKYWDKKDKPTKMDEITFKLMDDDNAILAAFKNGELDMADSFPTEELAALEQTPEYTRYGNIGLYYIQFQQMEGSDPALMDVNVRKALSLAIDRDYINETVYNNGRVSAYALCPGGIPDATASVDFHATGGDYTDPSTFFDLFKSTAGTNDGHYVNLEYDALIDEARTETDPVKRAQLYHDAETIIMNDMPFAPIVYYADDVLSQTNFTGFGVTGTGNKMFWDAVKGE